MFEDTQKISPLTYLEIAAVDANCQLPVQWKSGNCRSPFPFALVTVN